MDRPLIPALYASLRFYIANGLKAGEGTYTVEEVESCDINSDFTPTLFVVVLLQLIVEEHLLILELFRATYKMRVYESLFRLFCFISIYCPARLKGSKHLPKQVKCL